MHDWSDPNPVMRSRIGCNLQPLCADMSCGDRLDISEGALADKEQLLCSSLPIRHGLLCFSFPSSSRLALHWRTQSRGTAAGIRILLLDRVHESLTKTLFGTPGSPYLHDAIAHAKDLAQLLDHILLMDIDRNSSNHERHEDVARFMVLLTKSF